MAAADIPIPHSGMDALEAIYTARAMRRLKPDPIPDDVLRTIMDAAIRAPNGGNSQGWAFVVVRGQEQKDRIAAIYRERVAGILGPGGVYYEQAKSDNPEVAKAARTMIISGGYLAEHLHEAPAIVFALINSSTTRGASVMTGASVFPAVQNLIIAARAYGVGSTFTSMNDREAEVRAVLDLPEHVTVTAMIPLGYPLGKWGVAPRKPLEEVAFEDRWGGRLTF